MFAILITLIAAEARADAPKERQACFLLLGQIDADIREAEADGSAGRLEKCFGNREGARSAEAIRAAAAGAAEASRRTLDTLDQLSPEIASYREAMGSTVYCAASPDLRREGHRLLRGAAAVRDALKEQLNERLGQAGRDFNSFYAKPGFFHRLRDARAVGDCRDSAVNAGKIGKLFDRARQACRRVWGQGLGAFAAVSAAGRTGDCVGVTRDEEEAEGNSGQAPAP
jgi:hypothetical protein